MDRTMDVKLEHWLASIVNALNKQEAEPRTFEILFLSDRAPSLTRVPTPIGIDGAWIPSLGDVPEGSAAWDLRDPEGAPLAVIACDRARLPRWTFEVKAR